MLKTTLGSTELASGDAACRIGLWKKLNRTPTPNNDMSNEEFYDKEIAPALKQLCDKCMEREMAFVACVEFDPENQGYGRTEYQPKDEAGKLSSAQRLVHWAARSAGNIDKLFMACDKHGREHGHSSMYLSLIGNKNVKYTGHEMAAIAIISPK